MNEPPSREQDDMVDELAHMTGEPLSSAEKKLIIISLSLGVLLLGLLLWLSAVFFPAAN